MSYASGVTRGAIGALCWIAASVCACGLDSGGLLDDGGDDRAVLGDGVLPDAAIGDVWVSVSEGGYGADAPDDMTREAEANADVAADGGEVARKEAGAEEASGDARAEDAPVDARAQDVAGDARTQDAPADAATEDAFVEAEGLDAPVDTGGQDAGADARPDASRSPLIWDGGAIVDPQFFDSDWISFCVALVTCGELPSISACLSLLHQPSSPDALIPPPDMVNNVNNAAPSCPKIGKLLGSGSACPSSTADRCNANSLVTCRFGFMMTVDCGSLGMVCSNGNANPGCGFGDCSASQEGQTSCVGSSYVAQCTSGRYVPKLDCQTWGATCIGPEGTAQCQGTGGTSCTGGASCIGNSIVECLGGLLGSVDCSVLYDPSFTCIGGGASTPVCAAGTACDPGTYADTCQLTDQVNFCNAGVITSYDCTSTWNGCAVGRCTR